MIAFYTLMFFFGIYAGVGESTQIFNQDLFCAEPNVNTRVPSKINLKIQLTYDKFKADDV